MKQDESGQPKALAVAYFFADFSSRKPGKIFRKNSDSPPSESEWKLIGISTQATYEVEGLEVGVSYYFRVTVVTPAGTTEFCQPVLKLIV